ncbi:MAG: hypothetical protein OFPII_36500 [Osedax symbiont Rs1]|nr:MAG: hypothetical protein OFPII_36500 [Osedax symbiont Rs1]
MHFCRHGLNFRLLIKTAQGNFVEPVVAIVFATAQPHFITLCWI